MKGFIALLALLAIGIVFFGCTARTEYSANYSANGSAGAPASGGAQGASGGASSGATEPSGAETGGNGTQAGGGGASGAGTPEEETPPSTEPSAPPAKDLSGKNYSGLIGSGSASRCTVTSSDDSGKPLTLDLYFDGNNNMRMEQHDTGYTDCPYALMVYKGDSSGNGMLYLTCPGHEEDGLGQDFMTDEPCKWRSMDIEEQWGGVGTSGLGISNGYMTPSLEYLQSPVYSCQGWTLDGSKFDVSGFVCD